MDKTDSWKGKRLTMCGFKYSRPDLFRQLEQRHECRCLVCEFEQQLGQYEQECIVPFLTFSDKPQNTVSTESVTATVNRECFPHQCDENRLKHKLEYNFGNSLCFLRSAI